MRNLTLVLPEAKLWDNYFSVEEDQGELFCPTDEALRVGEAVRVKVNFTQGPRFYVSGVVIWRRPASGGARRLQAGVGVRIRDSERPKLDYIRGYVRGGLLDKRALRRLPIRLRVTYRTRAGRRMNFTRDITETGILLGAAELLPADTPVELTLVPPAGLPPQKLKGTVVRHVEDDRGSAMGIRLDFVDKDERARFAQMIRMVEKRFNSGELSEEFVVP